MAPKKEYPTVLLTYNAVSAELSGTFPDKEPFSYHAESGGGRGHTPIKDPKLSALYLHAQGTLLSSRMANTPEITVNGRYKQRGGTLPAGHYTCAYVQSASVGKDVIRLTAEDDAKVILSPFSRFAIPTGKYDPATQRYEPRSGFYIHGAGPKGSDGCIVIGARKDRLALSFAVRDYPGKVRLVVKGVGYVLPAELSPVDGIAMG